MKSNNAVLPCGCANPAEALQAIESEVRGLTRRGVSLPSALHRLGITTEVYRTASAFARTSDRYKLRALVEDWSFRTIQAGLGLQAAIPCRSALVQSSTGSAEPRGTSVCWFPFLALLTACLLKTV